MKLARPQGKRWINGEKDGIVLSDLATNAIGCYPVKDRSSESAYNAFKSFAGACRVDRLHTDGAPEFERSAKALGWNVTNSLPDDPTGNAIAENRVKQVLGGTRTCLNHAGLKASWWTYASRYWRNAKNFEIQKGDSPWNKRHKR